MKTARECAGEILTALGIPWHTDRLNAIERIIKEAMRDQRHACGVSLSALGKRLEGTFGPSPVEKMRRASVRDAIKYGRAAVQNTPFPGEGQ